MSYDSLSEDQRYKLLQFVKERPIIYDKHHENYKNTAEKEIAWQEVSDAVGAQLTACKVAWRTMRDQYRRNVRLPEDQKKKYRYLPKLEFLRGLTKGTTASNTSLDDITNEYYYENTSDIPKHEMDYDDSTDYGDYNETTTIIEPATGINSRQIDDPPAKLTRKRKAEQQSEIDIEESSPPEEEYIYIKDIRQQGDGTVENLASELFDTFNNLLNKKFQPNEDDNDIFLKMLAKKMKPLPKLVKNRLQESFLEQVNFEIVTYEMQKQAKK
ncbi:uncharacterized protein LOC142237152 [Haematobia irritans]|uniref:uncharacterized protein LOC142237152 n=1 Tax=Haematobia irritans TaxID=7368 RepID=UPI003F4F6E12